MITYISKKVKKIFINQSGKEMEDTECKNVAPAWMRPQMSPV